MIESKVYASHGPTDKLKPFVIQRREPNPEDIVIEIDYCGICHSDIHSVRSEWGEATYPHVPGHEIVGRVTQIGKSVNSFKVGDFAGVGCFVDSCSECKNCKNNEEQFCEVHCAFTYDSTEMDLETPTYGGYAKFITVKQSYALKIDKAMPLDKTAPLLCAGITTYSPLKRYGTKKGHKVGVIGLGGLGHIAVKIANAMGAEVTVFSTSENKKEDSKKLGAKNFVLSHVPENFEKHLGQLDLILDTVSAPHDLSLYLSTLKVGGTHVLVGISPEPNQLVAMSLVGGRKNLSGSLIGGIKETQEMLDFCAKHKIYADIELINADQINEAYERTVKGDVKYRFVMDTSTI